MSAKNRNVEIASRMLCELLLSDDYWSEWNPGKNLPPASERQGKPHGMYAAVARTITYKVENDPGYKGVKELDRSLRHRVRNALSGRVLSRPTLLEFFEVFGFTEKERHELLEARYPESREGAA